MIIGAKRLRLSTIVPLIVGSGVGAYLGGPALGQPILGAVAGFCLGASIAALLRADGDSTSKPRLPPLWPFALTGALLLAVPVVVSNLGEYEGTDVIVVLGPVALAFGAVLGTAVGSAVRRYHRKAT